MQGDDILEVGGWSEKTGTGLASPRVRKEARELEDSEQAGSGATSDK